MPHYILWAQKCWVGSKDNNL